MAHGYGKSFPPTKKSTLLTEPRLAMRLGFKPKLLGVSSVFIYVFRLLLSLLWDCEAVEPSAWWHGQFDFN